MPTPRYSTSQLKAVEELKKVRGAKKDGDVGDWISNLPELPDELTGERRVAIVLGKKQDKTSDEES